MVAILNAVGAINNYYGQPTRRQHRAAQGVINELDYAGIWRIGAGTINENDEMRLDMQGTFGVPVEYNLQVQVDGVNGHSSVAHVNVSSTLMTADPANQRGVAKKVRSALQQSLDNGQSYNLGGTIP